MLLEKFKNELNVGLLLRCFVIERESDWASEVLVPTDQHRVPVDIVQLFLDSTRLTDKLLQL